jgi:hypothetical protein
MSIVLRKNNSKFSKDVETNILGLIEVIGTEYVSDIFPRFVYKVNIEEWKKKELSTEFNDYLDSFKFNSYNSNENGEFIFYDNHNDTVISFVSPEIEMPLLITQEMSYDSIYEPYEYSISGETKFEQIIGEDVSIDEENDRVNNGSIWMQVISGASVVSVVKDYESLNDNVISYDSDTIEKRLYNELKPKSKFINVIDIEVESKLDSLFSPNTVMLNETYLGRFLDFDENYKDSFNAFKPVSDIRSLVNTKPSGGRLFKCVYKNKNYEKLVVTNEEIETSGEVSITTSELVFSGETFPQTELSGSRVRIINLRMGDETITEEKGNFTETETSIGKITSFQQSAITRQVYSYWECVEVDNIEDFICGDGENDILPNSDTENRYRNVPILSCLENFVKNPQIDDVYYFMARHDNGLAVKSTFENDNVIAYSGAVISLPAENTESGLEYKTFTIPFDVGTPLNITTFDDGTIMCDMITSISRFYHKNENNVDEGLSEDMIGIYYAKGIYVDSETYEPVLESGIHYYELLPYKPNKYAEDVFIDHAIPGSIYYDEVDYFYNTKTVSFNERNDLITRNARMAKIFSMEVGTEWTKHTACRTLVFTKDYSSTLKDNLKMELKSEFNRGLASAWETHFKLAECNTMDDLRQYGNNYFNI